jgi:rhamnosyltransferase subunit B
VHAVLTPVGSAGDVNPFVIVGAELRRRGHRVTMIGPDVFGGIASAAGLNFVAVGTRPEFEETTRDPDLWDPRRGPAIVFAAIARQMRQAYRALDAVHEPDQTVLVGHSLSFFTRVFEETHRVPAVTIHLSPGIFRSDFAQPVAPTGHDISRWPRWAKRAVWWALDRFAIDPVVAPALNAWRAELGLSPVSHVFKSWINSPQRVIALFPDWFGDPQPDWPPQARLTGFVLSDRRCAPTVDDVAGAMGPDRVLADGEPPIVFTPGSANRHAREFFDAAIDAAGTIGRRALLVTPYRDQLPQSLPAHAFHCAYAPFDALFPRAAAVVHHGGVGTCAQGLAAGVPQVIMPLGFDQPDNGARLKRLGVAEVIPRRHFDRRAVARVLEKVLLSSEVSAACRLWQMRMSAQDAVARTCDLIEDRHGTR